jgi:predicted Rossmann fold flavoprotein
MKTDVAIIIGAGAAGLMCAREAGRRGRRVVVLEHAERVGKKILISGGGRCNFTNLYSNPEHFLSSNEHFCKSALSRFKPEDFIRLIEKYKIEYYEKKLGQLFCKTSAKEITRLLLQECEDAGAEIRLNFRTDSIIRNEGFLIQGSGGTLQSDALVIATGGLSFANLGATDFGYGVARQFGLKVVECRPGLVPLTFHEEDRRRFSDLAGVSIEAEASCGRKSFRENILFTHQGLSGPAILQISSYWRPGETIMIDLIPDLSLAEELLEKKDRGEKTHLKNLLSQWLPHRFAERWCELYSPSRPLNECSDAQIRSAAEQLHHWRIRPRGTEGYEKAEVTLGGIDPAELSSKTLEARKVPGLYFIGEVVDVTGHLGGHNFQWAWASGFAAGQVL